MSVYTLGNDARAAGQAIVAAYPDEGASAANKVDSLFLAVVFDRRDSSLHIFSDMFSSPFNMYYTLTGGRLYYSTSLKWVLLKSNIKREFSEDSVNEFLINGFVFGRNTLLKDIYKLTPGVDLTVKGGKLSENRLVYYIPGFKKSEAQKTLIKTIQKSILRFSDDKTDLYLPLSGGFDSNLVLNTVKTQKNLNIHAFTVGGKRGRSEIAQVRRNLIEYPEIDLHVTEIDESYFDKISDIVWRLDGCIYEAGIVLQYALAKSVFDAGGRELICGEYADQILNKYFTADSARSLAGKNKHFERYYYYTNPYVMGNMVILKKSAVMLNSFGITGCYPFLSKSILAYAKPLAGKNGSEKKFYKKECLKIFPVSITNNIKKIGGSTSNQSILADEEYEKLKFGINNSDEINVLCRRTHPSYIPRTVYLKRIKQIISFVINDIRTDGIIKGPKKTLAAIKSKGMSEELKKVYLLLFKELFVSGKYDGSFENESSPVSTYDILKDHGII